MGRKTRKRLEQLEASATNPLDSWKFSLWLRVQQLFDNDNSNIDLNTYSGRRAARRLISSDKNIDERAASQYVKLLREKQKSTYQLNQNDINYIYSIYKKAQDSDKNLNLEEMSLLNKALSDSNVRQQIAQVENWKAAPIENVPELQLVDFNAEPKFNTSLKLNTISRTPLDKQLYIKKLNSPISAKDNNVPNTDKEYNFEFNPLKANYRDYDFLNTVDFKVLKPYLESGLNILRRKDPGSREQLHKLEIEMLKGERPDKNSMLTLLLAHNVNPINDIYRAWARDVLESLHLAGKVDDEDYEYNKNILN